jgi:ribosomal protein S18 acetylase RimI-like enzyme
MDESFPKKEKLDIQVKVAKPEDWQQLKKIRLEALRENPEAFGGDLNREEKMPDAHWEKGWLSNEDRFVIMAQSGSEPIGLAGVRKIENEEGVWWVFSVYVAKSFRKSGAGQEIMKEIEKVVRKKGGTTIQLNVRKNKPQISAIKLYVRSGYKVIKTESADIYEGMKYLMQKKLT